MTTENLHELLSGLSGNGMTVRLLNLLDYLVPGQWTNITQLEDLIRSETEEEDQEVIDAVGARAIELYMDPETGYQRANQLYLLVDSGSTFAGFTSAAAKLAEDVEWLGFLGKVTPKPETTQSIDAGLKLAAELAAFCASSGMPGDSIGDFMTALGNSAREDKMRLAFWVACDCMLPLGPEFMDKILSAVSRASESDFMNSGLFGRLRDYLPGTGGVAEQKDLVARNLDSARGHVDHFVKDSGITHDGVVAKIQEFIGKSESRLDYAAAIIDMSTNTFEHTGAQSVARRAVRRAYGEI